MAEHAAGARTAGAARHAVGQRRQPLVGDRLPAARAVLDARHGRCGRRSPRRRGFSASSASSTSAIRIRGRSAIVLTLAAAAWALWTAYQSRSSTIRIRSHAIRNPQSTSGCSPASAAFLVHAYATLSAQVHENHLFAAVPLLVLASAGRRAFRADLRRRQRGGGAEPEPVLRIWRRDRLRAAARA